MAGSMPIKHVVARFYVTTDGANPVRDRLMRLPPLDRKQVGHDVRVEFGWPIDACPRVVLCDRRRIAFAARLHQEDTKDAAKRFVIREKTNEGGETMRKRKNHHIGGRFDDWLKEEGIYEETTNASIKKVVAWQIQQAMEQQKLTRTEMARRMATSRVQLNRLLDPDNDSVTLGTLTRAATAIGRRLRLELV